MAKLAKSDVPFGMVPNNLLNNQKISFKAKGLFAFMQSKPEGWNFSAKMIAFQSKESIDSVSAGLKELESNGFLVRQKVQSASGFQTIYKLFFDTDLQNPITENPTLENPILENPILENPMLGKTLNNSNKELSKKDIRKKEERGAFDFLKNNSHSELENFEMRFRKKIAVTEWEKFKELFECKVVEEEVEFTSKKLIARLTRFAINYTGVLDKEESKVIKMQNHDAWQEKASRPTNMI